MNNNQGEANPISSSSSDDERYGSSGSSGDAGDHRSRSTSNYESETSSNEESDSKPLAVPEYQDFSHLSPLGPDGRELAARQGGSASVNREPTFPGKLHAILASPQYNDVITWLPHGRSWRILKHKALESTVLPIFFRHANYSSFARQVNGWGFRRISTGSNYNSYYHPLFLRGLPCLSARMKRLSSRDIANRSKESNAATPPDFFAFSRDNPLPAAIPPPDMQISQVPVPSDGIPQRPNEAKSSEIAALEQRKKEILQRLKESLDRNTNPEHKAAILAAIGESAEADRHAPHVHQAPIDANHSSFNSSNGPNVEPSGRAEANDMLQFVSRLRHFTETLASSHGSARGHPSEASLLSILQQLLSVADQLPKGLESLLEIVRLLVQHSQNAPSSFPSNLTFNGPIVHQQQNVHQPPPLFQQYQQPFIHSQMDTGRIGQEAEAGNLLSGASLSQVAHLLRSMTGSGSPSEQANQSHRQPQSYAQPVANPAPAASMGSDQTSSNGESEVLRQALISLLHQQTKPQGS